MGIIAPRGGTDGAVIDLYVFSQDELASEAAALGVDAVIVDLERHDKERRQGGADTDISTQTVRDLGDTRLRTDLPIICRIDAVGEQSATQIDQVIEAGTDEILIPMVRHPVEVEWVLGYVDGHVAVGVMVETVDAVANAAELSTLPISRAYVGLNDLWIERRSNHRFSAFTDGTLDHLAGIFESLPFGVAGLTHPELGRPLPCFHLINELVRLGCDFTFLRRSFFHAIKHQPAPDVVAAIRAADARAGGRTADVVESDRRAAWRAIDSLTIERLDMTA